MIMVVVMALVVGVVRGNLFDGGRHLARIDKTRQHGSSELLNTHPPHPVGSFSMFLCESTPSEESLPSSRTSDVLLMLSPTLVVVDVESGRLARPGRLMTKQAKPRHTSQDQTVECLVVAHDRKPCYDTVMYDTESSTSTQTNVAPRDLFHWD